MNKNESLELCGLMLTLWPNFAVTETTNAVYAEMLKDVSLREAIKAIKLIASTDKSEFAPGIGKIREALRKLKRPNEKTVEEKFAALIKLAEKVGFDGWEQVKAKLHPETLRAVNAISWRRFCYDPIDAYPFLLRDFKAVYESVLDSSICNEAASQLVAIPEQVRKLLKEATNEKKNQQALGAR